jgi:hypothetical protein
VGRNKVKEEKQRGGASSCCDEVERAGVECGVDVKGERKGMFGDGHWRGRCWGSSDGITSCRTVTVFFVCVRLNED